MECLSAIIADTTVAKGLNGILAAVLQSRSVGLSVIKGARGGHGRRECKIASV